MELVLPPYESVVSGNMSSSTPSIWISREQRYHSPPTYPPSFAAAAPMAIQRAQEAPPPPLPPPSYIPDISAGHDPGWQWGNDPSGSDFGRPASVKAGSSLLGGATWGFRQEKERDDSAHDTAGDTRRGSSISTVTFTRESDMADDHMSHSDEDGSVSRPSSNYRYVWEAEHLTRACLCAMRVPKTPSSRLTCCCDRLQSERQLEQRTLEQSSNTYDKQLLSRIGGPNTPKRLSVSYTNGLPDIAQLSQSEGERRSSGQLKPLSLPERRHAHSNSIESPASSRWPSSGALSPGFTAFWGEHGPSDSRTPATRHGSLAFDDSTSHRGSYDHSMFINEDLMEDGQMSSLNLHDRSPSGSDDSQLKPGTKRRASSPPREGTREERCSMSSAAGHNEIYHRRSMQQLPNRGSPISRFQPSHSSVSSASSFGPRHGSLGSSLGIASIPSSATSYGSGRISPSALSPTVDPGLRLGTPYEGARAQGMTQQRTIPENPQQGRRPSTDSAAHSRHGSLSHMQGVYICECCPKKPKKFDTQDELR